MSACIASVAIVFARSAACFKHEPLAVHVQVTHKPCRRCNTDKSADDFFKSKLSLDGLCSYCKACQKDLNQQSRAKRAAVDGPKVSVRFARAFIARCLTWADCHMREPSHGRQLECSFA